MLHKEDLLQVELPFVSLLLPPLSVVKIREQIHSAFYEHIQTNTSFPEGKSDPSGGSFTVTDNCGQQ